MPPRPYGTDTECISALLRIAAEQPSPLTRWERDFLRTISASRCALSSRQQEILDDLVRRHLTGDDR